MEVELPYTKTGAAEAPIDSTAVVTYVSHGDPEPPHPAEQLMPSCSMHGSEVHAEGCRQPELWSLPQKAASHLSRVGDEGKLRRHLAHGIRGRRGIADDVGGGQARARQAGAETDVLQQAATVLARHRGGALQAAALFS